MKCENCSKENRSAALFCRYCGTKLKASVEGKSVLESLIGLDTIRNELDTIIKVLKSLSDTGSSGRINCNMILTGNSGTAKSLIGNLIFSSLKQINFITKPSPNIINSSDFNKMDTKDILNLLQNNQGGMIILDNAHELFPEGEACDRIKRLVVEMGQSNEKKNEPILFLCGLPYGLREFLNKPENTWFSGRFGKIYHIDDYNSEILKAIIKENLYLRFGLELSPDAEKKLLTRTAWLVRESKNPEAEIGAMNGYLALKETDKIIFNFYNRGKTDKTILPDDISGDVLVKKNAEEILQSFDQFIGMEPIKKDIRQVYTKISQDLKLGKKTETNLHAVLTGNPGTGKTSVVRILGEVYAALGVLDVGHVVEVDRSKLVAGYQGQTAIQVNRVVDSALGGILFVDEAYAIIDNDNDSFGKEALNTLLKRVEDDRDKFCCIAAGYKKEMHKFMDSNPGMESRFPKRFHLDDYSAHELNEIFKLICRKEGFILEQKADEDSLKYFEEKVARKTKDFGNGRESRSLFDGARNNLANRITAMEDGAISADDMITIKQEDIPSIRGTEAITVEEALQKLNNFIGLKNVKDKVREIADTLEVNKMNGSIKPMGEHFTFIGNPGTGKTSVARILGDVFYAIGLLPTRNIIEVTAKDLIAKYKGQTGPQTDDIINQAMGGILFIDEAYSLVDEQGDSFGKDAINTLLQRMENDRGKFICIAAGYKKEMHTFLASNSGFESRFTEQLDFEDYSAQELTQIFLKMCSGEGYHLDDEAAGCLQGVFEALVLRKTPTFANAREARKIFESTKKRLSSRIMSLKRQGAPVQELMKINTTIIPEDLPLNDSHSKKKTLEEAVAPLYEQIGLKNVKENIQQMINRIELNRIQGRDKLLEVHYVFTGNPGTGKTTVARIMTDIFYAAGILPTNNLIECGRQDLVAGYIGQTAIKTNDVINRAMGGVLFIDEAYMLSQTGGSNGDFGQEAIDTLLLRLENDRGKFICIAAGYKDEMKSFIDSNPGLERRFTEYLEFQDYTAREASDIFRLFARKGNYTLSPELDAELEPVFTKVIKHPVKQFSNAGTARVLFEKTERALSDRLMEMRKNKEITHEGMKEVSFTLLKEDLLSVYDTEYGSEKRS